MKSSPDDPANTRSNGPNLVSGTLMLFTDGWGSPAAAATADDGWGWIPSD